ncbi:MAG TPA: HemK/PrmC family methyltransferase [Actinomycetota bacterium]|nr:HemK/PrmC family methyltransferase [Actinomycetota bacterium]
MKAFDLIDSGRKRLLQSPEVTRRGDERDQAAQMLERAIGLVPDDDDEVPAAAVRRYERLLDRRASGEPLAYILGYIEFRHLRLGVRPGAFIPRGTSEFLAESAIRRTRGRRDPIAIDLATGVGPVALSVAEAVPGAEVHGTDLAREAVLQARRNARELALDNASFHCGDLFAPLPRRLRGGTNVMTVHPPYVPRHEVKLLPAEIRRFEPVDSLTDRSPDGLGLVSRVVAESGEWLTSGGWLLMEVHPSDTRVISRMLRDEGFGDVRSVKGPLKWTRVVTARA